MSKRAIKRLIRKQMLQHLASDVRVFVHRKHSVTNRDIHGVETRKVYTVEAWQVGTNRYVDGVTAWSWEWRDVVVNAYEAIIEHRPHWLKYLERRPKMKIA